jgi:hypothetical protein
MLVEADMHEKTPELRKWKDLGIVAECDWWAD